MQRHTSNACPAVVKLDENRGLIEDSRSHLEPIAPSEDTGMGHLWTRAGRSWTRLLLWNLATTFEDGMNKGREAFDCCVVGPVSRLSQCLMFWLRQEKRLLSRLYFRFFWILRGNGIKLYGKRVVIFPERSLHNILSRILIYKQEWNFESCSKDAVSSNGISLPNPVYIQGAVTHNKSAHRSWYEGNGCSKNLNLALHVHIASNSLQFGAWS